MTSVCSFSKANEKQAIDFSFETLDSLYKEPILSRGRVRSAFNRALKMLNEQMLALPKEFKKSAVQLLIDTRSELIGNFNALKKQKKALIQQVGLPLCERETSISEADKSKLWHQAIDHFKMESIPLEDCINEEPLPPPKKNCKTPDNTNLQYLAASVHKEFVNPVALRMAEIEVVAEVVGKVADGIAKNLLEDLVCELIRIEKLKNAAKSSLSNCDEKGN